MRSGTHGLMSVSGAADSSSPSWAAASVSESAAMLPVQQNTTSTQTHQQFMGGGGGGGGYFIPFLGSRIKQPVCNIKTGTQLYQYWEDSSEQSSFCTE